MSTAEISNISDCEVEIDSSSSSVDELRMDFSALLEELIHVDFKPMQVAPDDSILANEWAIASEG